MKLLLTRKQLVLPLALTGAVLPLVLIGCGGGNGNGPAKTRPGAQTSVPPTSIPPTAVPTTALPEFNFSFDNGQTVRFFGGTLTGNAVNAQITVSGAQSDPLQVPPGTYSVAGTVNNAGVFDLNSSVGRITGLLPTSTTDGNYTFTATNGQPEGGTIPRGTVVIPPTAVPPTAVPPTSIPPTSIPPTSIPPTSIPPTSVPNNGQLTFSGTLNFSGASSGNNVDQTPLNLAFDDSGSTDRNFGKITTFPDFNNGQILESDISLSKNAGTGAGAPVFRFQKHLISLAHLRQRGERPLPNSLTVTAD